MKSEKIESFFKDALKSMKSKQDKMMSTYGFRQKENLACKLFLRGGAGLVPLLGVSPYGR